jgi:hypothetical protein
VRTTLVSEGSSDRALLPVLHWLLLDLNFSGSLEQQWADLRQLPRPPRGLPERIRKAVELYPCDLLFVHRDAETMPLSERRQELRSAVQNAGLGDPPAAVCVVPVRMMEAWLLFDERALRQAAGRPSGRHPLGLPRRQHLEDLTDPKGILHRLLVEASGVTGRRRKKFPTVERVHRLANLIEDYSPLRVLPAFRELEQDLRDVLQANRWISAPY